MHPLTSEEKAETVQLLIEHGADLRAQDKTHTTTLHMALSLGSPEIVRLLFEQGLDVTTNDCRHRTPLNQASSYVSAKNTFLDPAQV